MKLTMDFAEIGADDLPLVGGKNASLGEMWNTLRPLGINVLDGSVARRPKAEKPLRR